MTAEPFPAHLACFDLAPHRTALADLAVAVYATVARAAEHTLAPLLVPALLLHEPLPGVVAGFHPEGSPAGASEQAAVAAVPVTVLTAALTRVHTALADNGVDPRLTRQVLAQLFAGANATVANHLLLRKEFCHWSRGLQVRPRVFR